MCYKDKQVLLFGAGMRGRNALTCYGERFIDGFVDNNMEKCGKQYMGKPVISYAELCENKEKYDVIIANQDICAVEKQLAGSGITPIGTYFYRSCCSIEDMVCQILADTKRKVGLYGCDVYTQALLFELSLRDSDYAEKSILFIDRDDSSHCGSIRYSKKVFRLSEVCRQVKMVIITVPKYNRAIDVRLRRELAGQMGVEVFNPFGRQTKHTQRSFVINRYSSAAAILTEEEYNNKTTLRVNSYIRDMINAFADEAGVAVPLFCFVEMETHNRCNGCCTFCPVNSKVDPREYHEMDKELFKKIILQLAQLDYSGYISLYSNNEPFLDKRLLEFSSFMREKLPNAFIYLFTNGTLLTVDNFKAIYPMLDSMTIDNYNQDMKLIPSVQRIHDFCEENPEYKEKVSIHLRLDDEILTTRGGNSPNRKQYRTYGDVKCARPFQQLVIRPTGEVSLCCNDAVGKYTMGDLTKENILDVWYGERFSELREAILRGRECFDNCRYCDIFTLG